MRRLTIVILTALVAAGCGGNSQLTADEVRAALPVKEQAQLSVPGGGTSSTSALVQAATAQNQTAPFAEATIDLALAVNGSVVWTLDVLRAVVLLPPTACAADTCTWGPGSNALDLNTWKLTVTRTGDAAYAWALAGQPKSNAAAPFTTVLSGHAFPGGTPRVGHGDLLLDLDAAAALDRSTIAPAPATGTIAVQYDNTSHPTVAVTSLGTADANNAGQKVNAAYAFSSTGTGGDLQVATRNTTSNDTFSLRSQWNATGAGRGDAAVSSSLASYHRTECWDGASTLLNLLYRQSTPADPTDMGSASLCAFPAAPLTIVAP